MIDTNVVPFVQPQPPAVPFSDMVRLAEAVAKSRLFGISTPDQALALMAIAQAEGRHPALAARDYHIINNSPSKKAEAMQRDFLMAGGKIEWIELSDDAVEATFSHPIGGTATIRWDNDRCKRAGLSGGNHAKYPRQMKRSRVVSEGVRTVWPLATSGFYVPEEVAEFDHPQRQAPPADTRTDLDVFAATKPADVIDAETGEVLDARRIEIEARSAAAKGTEHFRGYLIGLSKEARAVLRPLIGTRDAPGELTVLAQRTDEALRADPRDDEPDDAFGLPIAGEPNSHTLAGDGNHATPPQTEERDAVGGPGRTAPAPSHPAPAGGDIMPDLLGGAPRSPRSLRVRLQDETSTGWNAWEAAIIAMVESGDDPAAIRRDNADNLQIFEQIDSMRHNKLMRKLGAQ